MFGLGELLIVLIIVAVAFGAGKLPQVMEAMGRGVREFRDASKEFEEAARLEPPKGEKKP